MKVMFEGVDYNLVKTIVLSSFIVILIGILISLILTYCKCLRQEILSNPRSLFGFVAFLGLYSISNEDSIRQLIDNPPTYATYFAGLGAFLIFF
ncbi:MAG: hypothetical protein HC932_06025 [Thermales bacterium]|nr:hypothetical protein [Thermales bacterium]